MSEPTLVSDEFTAAMQQLSAEASKSVGSSNQSIGSGTSAGISQSMEQRLQALEVSLTKKIAELVSTLAHQRNQEISLQFRKIEEQLDAIRNTESVNQKLFDSLHDELIKYRDNFVHESLQKPFIHDLVHLFDDLSALAGQLNAQESKKKGAAPHWRENLENAVHSLVEILHRFDVREIEPQEKVDRALHKVVSYEPADFPEDDGRIVMRLKRGFLWRDKLIRPEEVIAKRAE